MTNKARGKLKEIEALDAIWGKVATFTLTWWIYWAVFEVADKPIGGPIFREHNDSAPLFALWGGLLLTLTSLCIFVSRVRRSGARSHLGRVPPLWFNVALNTDTGKRWKLFTIIVGVIIPTAFAAWFWVRFQMRQTWPNVSGTAPPSPYGLWRYVSPWHVLSGFNDYRYGFDDADRWNRPLSSASFVPLWEPLILVLLSLITLAVLFRLVCSLIAPDRNS
jgi:hypothetical protein